MDISNRLLELANEAEIALKDKFAGFDEISFKYTTAAPKGKTAEMRKGERYLVSPFKIIINDGNYYLLAFDGKSIKPYRVDRMKGVSLTGEPREGQAEFDKIDIRTYTQRVFSMFGGKKERVTIRFDRNCRSCFGDDFRQRLRGRRNAVFSGRKFSCSWVL